MTIKELRKHLKQLLKDHPNFVNKNTEVRLQATEELGEEDDLHHEVTFFCIDKNGRLIIAHSKDYLEDYLECLPYITLANVDTNSQLQYPTGAAASYTRAMAARETAIDELNNKIENLQQNCSSQQIIIDNLTKENAHLSASLKVYGDLYSPSSFKDNKDNVFTDKDYYKREINTLVSRIKQQDILIEELKDKTKFLTEENANLQYVAERSKSTSYSFSLSK